MSRFPRAFVPVTAVAGLAALLLIPAGDTQRPAASLAVASDPIVVGSTRSGGMGPTASPQVPAIVTAYPAPLSAPIAPKPDDSVTAVASTEPTPRVPVVLPAAVEEDEVIPQRTLWVGRSAVNVRVGPSAATAKLFVLRPGQKVSASESSGGWTLIVADNGESGWVSSRYLSDVATPAKAAPPKATAPKAKEPAASAEEPRLVRKLAFARVTSPVTLRARPSRLAPRLFVLRPGERIAVLETRGRWVHVVLESGVSAWADGREL